MTVQRVEVPVGHGFKAWMPEAITPTRYVTKPTTIVIASPDTYHHSNAFGPADSVVSTSYYRIVDSGDDWLDITDDWAEADRLMGITS